MGGMVAGSTEQSLFHLSHEEGFDLCYLFDYVKLSNATDSDSGTFLTLALKDCDYANRESIDRDTVVREFAKCVFEFLLNDQSCFEEPLLFATVPSSKPGSTQRGIDEVSSTLKTWFGSWVHSHSRDQILRRIKEIEPAHQGGRRDEGLHLASMEVEKWPGVADRTVVLLDDVVTTGSSMRACKKLLLDAGAKRVICVAFAKTKWAGACGSREGCEARPSALLSEAKAKFGSKPKRKERFSKGLLLDVRYLGDVAFAKMESGEVVFIPTGSLEDQVLPVGYEVGYRVSLGYSSDGRFFSYRLPCESSGERSSHKKPGIFRKRVSANGESWKAPDFTFGEVILNSDRLIREAFGISDKVVIGEVGGDAFSSFREIWESAQEDWDRSPFGRKGSSALYLVAVSIAVVGVLLETTFLPLPESVDFLWILFVVAPCSCCLLRSFVVWLVRAAWCRFEGLKEKVPFFEEGDSEADKKFRLVSTGFLGFLVAGFLSPSSVNLVSPDVIPAMFGALLSALLNVDVATFFSCLLALVFFLFYFAIFPLGCFLIASTPPELSLGMPQVFWEHWTAKKNRNSK